MLGSQDLDSCVQSYRTEQVLNTAEVVMYDSEMCSFNYSTVRHIWWVLLPRTASCEPGSRGWHHSSHTWCVPQPAGLASRARWCSAACNLSDWAGSSDDPWSLPGCELQKIMYINVQSSGSLSTTYSNDLKPYTDLNSLIILNHFWILSFKETNFCLECGREVELWIGKDERQMLNTSSSTG